MSFKEIDGKFIATAEKGEVSSVLIRPDDAELLLVLGHGSGSNYKSNTLRTIAEACAKVGVATFRYNFPYMERGGGGRESQPVALETVKSAANAGHAAAPDLPLVIGGHSYSGRMTSHSAADAPIPHAKGIVFFAFPLHSGKPSTDRAEHLAGVTVPMLFLSGTRDSMADVKLLESVAAKLPTATLHWLDTAEHGFKTLKRRNTDEDVFDEMARVLKAWAAAL